MNKNLTGVSHLDSASSYQIINCFVDAPELGPESEDNDDDDPAASPVCEYYIYYNYTTLYLSFQFTFEEAIPKRNPKLVFRAPHCKPPKANPGTYGYVNFPCKHSNYGINLFFVF